MAQKPKTPTKRTAPAETPPAPQKSDPLTSTTSNLTPLQLWSLVRNQDDTLQAQLLIIREVKKIIDQSPLASRYNVLFLWTSNLDDFELGRMYNSLESIDKDKSLLLIINSPGGSAEAAYLISKALKGGTRKKFVVAVPRKAKSAATLLSMGADEIHMSPISELGPIDPQIGNMPVLGMQDALDHICTLAIAYPGASNLLASYLEKTMRPEYLGYSSRVAESAKQYAEILLENKKGKLPSGQDPASVGRDLVYEFKSHGFVIDSEQAIKWLGRKIIKTDTEEVKFALLMHEYIDSAALALSTVFSSRPIISGPLDDMVIIKN